ncbi:hypothetical protein [Streptomyces sp. NBC_00996]|uniref:hypothetical protein n=1 Tax=Streptomyces sp. NBC_00996 TaxID=2903710 RepID=UPI003863B491|nr:hypothetical protein OG390_02815 [Streptomyces sp. NBC_00996]
MEASPIVSHLSGKSRFDDIYEQPDPRPYFRRLAPLQYEIPHHAQPVFRRSVEECRARSTGRPDVTVLDICCSYGINAALLNHDLTLADLYTHYTRPAATHLTAAELIHSDKEFYAARRRDDAVAVVGLDVSAPAIKYAVAVGLLDHAYAENLERRPPSAALRRAVSRVGLLTLTGGGSYITERTFGAVLACTRSPAQVAAFVLRSIPYGRIAAVLASHGLHTAVDRSRTYPQRLFTGPEEQRMALADVVRAGLDPSGREASGRYHAVLYESRPAPEEPAEAG